MVDLERFGSSWMRPCRARTGSAHRDPFPTDTVDPVTSGAFRFDIGFLPLLPMGLALANRRSARADWPGIVALGWNVVAGMVAVRADIGPAATDGASARPRQKTKTTWKDVA